ncbi:hypothetical protein [Halomonas sp. MMSF_3323]|uniref:hypothetical protein n=1 Tax=Halomonas sp. MMSF_3323 TaxID=3046701 RepID=UPI00273E57E0|nr:hypothetical protein [Halomonas sp. MMSF_3323]
MTNKSLFLAYNGNVKELSSAWAQLRRSINTALVNNDLPSLKVHTKLLTLTFSAYAEALFSKLIYTPNSFNDDEIGQIKNALKNNVRSGWKKALKISISKINSTSNHKPNLEKEIAKLIEERIINPSLLRNKIAHGQWRFAMNKKGNAINHDTTDRLNSIDAVELERKRIALDGLYRIIEDIIVSPNKAHLRDYWTIKTKVEQEISKAEGWTLEEKAKKLKEKRNKKPTP